MKGTGSQPVNRCALEFSPDARHHFSSGIVGIGERNNFVGTRMTFADKVGYTLREDGGFPRPSSGDDQQRAMNVSDRLLLAFIGNNLRRK
jgi:hypothetical protein